MSDKSVVIGKPLLLLIDYVQGALVHYHESGETEHPPVRVPHGTITFGDAIYRLAALIYSNDRHVNCTVFIGKGALFYDGILKKPRWLLPNKLEHPDK